MFGFVFAQYCKVGSILVLCVLRQARDAAAIDMLQDAMQAVLVENVRCVEVPQKPTTPLTNSLVFSLSSQKQSQSKGQLSKRRKRSEEGRFFSALERTWFVVLCPSPPPTG